MHTYPHRLKQMFVELFHKQPQLMVKAPGRINLLGEHTDYNGGFVLPAAMDKAIYFAISKREDMQCRLYSENMLESHTFLVDALKHDNPRWSFYIKGVIMEFQKAGIVVGGFDLVFGGNIPQGAGVSSSAALECGLAYALNVIFGFGISKIELVKLAQAAENNFVGVKCGIMDQFASMMSKKDTVIKLDCRSLKYEYFPFDMQEYNVVLCDTGVKHNLADSEYNTRRQQCEAGIALLKKYDPEIQSLRDVSMDFLVEHIGELPELIFKRCKYVVDEIARVEEACNLLLKNDLKTFGERMYATHDGLQHLYAVSCPELDFLVDHTRALDHVAGARMMGGGFGGCTINLVAKDAMEEFVADISRSYLNGTNKTLKTYTCTLADGVESIVEWH